ncbi:MAG: hypothetical protein AAGA56_22540 [Myxococcota bacterium]
MNHSTMRISLRHLAFASVTAALVVMGSGCSGGLGGLCDDICDCTGDCSENFRAECKDSADDLERRVDDEGCNDQFDRYVDCLNDEFECRNGDVDLDGCDSRGENLGSCLGSNVGFDFD